MPRPGVPEPEPSFLPVQAVCRATGLSPDVLRVWERRYEAVSPRRSAGGQRVYTESEVARLRTLARLVARGHRIGQLARRSDAELAALLDELPALGAPPAIDDPLSEGVLEECLQAAMDLDAAALDSALQRAAALLGLARCVEEVHAPFLRELGRRWEAGALTPSHEHFGSTRARSQLLALIAAQGSRSDAPRFLATTPSGERHEFGALLSAVVAAGEGWNVTYLGADVPARDIASAARQIGADAVALSVVHPDPSIDIRAEIRQLVELLAPLTPVIVGGEWCLFELRHLARAGVRHEGSLAGLRSMLREIRAERPS